MANRVADHASTLSDCFAHRYRDSNGRASNTYPNAIADRYSDSYALVNGHADGHPYADGDGRTPNMDPNAIPNRDGHACPDPNTNTRLRLPPRHPPP